jgi:hypothetical protein
MSVRYAELWSQPGLDKKVRPYMKNNLKQKGADGGMHAQHANPNTSKKKLNKFPTLNPGY